MARPTHKHPYLRTHDSDAANATFGVIFEQTGTLGWEAIAQVRRVSVFRFVGPTGCAILAEAAGKDAAPGVFFVRASAWIRHSGRPGTYVLEGQYRSWDPWAYAADTGDESVTNRPRAQIYRLRDERSRAVGATDEARVIELDEGQVPALLVGLAPPTVRRLAAEHVPGLLGDAG